MFFPCLAALKVLGCCYCNLLSCRNLKLCDLKVQSHLQSVVIKGRINCRLPGYHNVVHLKITMYLGYLLLNAHKIWGTTFATFSLTFCIYSATLSLHSLEQK